MGRSRVLLSWRDKETPKITVNRAKFQHCLEEVHLWRGLHEQTCRGMRNRRVVLRGEGGLVHKVAQGQGQPPLLVLMVPKLVDSAARPP